VALGPALLAACGGSKAAAGTVRVVNQTLMMDDNTPGLFEHAANDFLAYTEYTDPARFVALHRAAFVAHHDIGADIVVLPDAQTQQLIAQAWVRPLGAVAARRRLLPAFANPAFDPGRRFSIPYASTQIGLAYDKRRVHSPVTTARAIFDPAFAGKVVLSADPAATLGLVLLASGHDPAKVTNAQANAAFARVLDAVDAGQIHSFATTQGLDAVSSGDATLAIARACDVRLATSLAPHLRFVVPSEGGLLSSLNMLVPAGATAVAPADAFVDYMASPDPASRIASFANMVMPVAGGEASLVKIDVKASADPLVVPPAAVWSRLRIFDGTERTAEATGDLAGLAAAHPA
jgi:spermidine/putrescine transport system substrate-binding protein